MLCSVAGDGHQALMNGVDNPAGLGIELLLIFGGRSNPVLGTDNNGRCIQIIKGKVGDAQTIADARLA